MTVARAVARLLLCAYPRRFRARFGDALVRDFAAAARDGQMLRNAIDLFVGGLSERRRERRDRPGVAAWRVGGAQVAADTRFALRALTRRPAFATAAVLTLGVGIGANTAIFSVAYGILLRPLPYHEPDRLVVAWETNERAGLPRMSVAPANLIDWRASGAAADIAGFTSAGATLATDEGSEHVRLARVTPNLFTLLGVRASIGRALEDRDGADGAPAVVALGDRYWRARFGADPAIVGRALVINGTPVEVAGVMPAGFHFPPPVSFEPQKRPDEADIFIPYRWNEMPGRSSRFLTAIARLPDGVSREQAEAALRGVAASLESTYPESNGGWSLALSPLADEIVGNVRPAVLVLVAAVGLLLLLACVNVAHLLLARAIDRQREMAVRAALGAGRLRLARQLAVEGAVLAVVGGAAGLIIAAWAVGVLVSLAPASVPRLDAVRLDAWTLVGAGCSVLVAAVAASLAPMAQLRHTAALRDRSGVAGPRAGAAARLFLGGEVAMAVVLVVLAVLLGQSFAAMRGIGPGFSADNVLMFRVRLAGPAYGDPARRAVFVENLRNRLLALPGVLDAGTTDAAPLDDDRQGTDLFVDGAAPLREPTVNVSMASAGYFEALRIRVTAGRSFTAADRADAEPVAIVNASLARRFFPDGNAVGATIRTGFQTQLPRRIVGVVEDERHATLTADVLPAVYVPVAQLTPYSHAVFLRAASDPGGLAGPARRVVRELDESLAVYDIKPMTTVIEASLAMSRFVTVLIAALALTALVLAGVGVYGVASHGVARRTPEIGVRMALGASRRAVLRAVLVPSLAAAGTGMLAGTIAAGLAAALLSSFFFGVSALDPSLYGMALGVVGSAVLAACWIPAVRASRVDPIVALRDR